MNYTGLTVRNGRLINERPIDKTGIQEMADMRKAAKVAKKVAMQVEAITVAKALEHGMGGCQGCM